MYTNLPSHTPPESLELSRRLREGECVVPGLNISASFRAWRTDSQPLE